MACPFRGFREWILEEVVPLYPISAFGQAIHYSFERFFKPHPRTRRYPFEDQQAFLGQWFMFWWTAAAASGASASALAFWNEWLEKQQAERRTKGRKPFRPPAPHGFGSWSDPPDQISWRNDEQPLQLYRWGRQILRQFHDDFLLFRADGVRRLVERRFVFNWHGFTLSGYLDRTDLRPEGAVLTDYKLDLYPAPLLDTDLQFTLYQLAWLEYFRKKLPDWKPLSAIRLYNYRSRVFQEVPIREPREFGLLLAYLVEASAYYRGILTGELAEPSLLTTFRNFNPADLERGDTSPRLPRGDHCRYCPRFSSCRQWELGQQAKSARELFLDQHQQELSALQPTQLPLNLGELPLVRQGRHSIESLPAEHPIEGDLFFDAH